jgi:dephospho-CoA kinase
MVDAKRIIIGVTGTMTSGKGALQYFLVNRGFLYIRNTAPILDEGLKSKTDMKDRENWLKILVELRKKEGLEVLTKRAEKKMSEDEESDRFVVCPIRHPADITYLKKKYNALIIFIDAPFKLRYRRTLIKELGSGLTEEEFKKKDDFEKNPTGENAGYLPNIEECRKLADEVITNDKTLNDLNDSLDKVLRKHNIPDFVDSEAFEDVDI